jgi:phosphopantothenoylcysteine decarboxylase
MNILLCLTGSVAAIKADELYSKLCETGKGIGVTNTKVKVVATPAATHFINASIPVDDYYTDKLEWFWRKIGDPVYHIELKDWTDVLVIAPLSANTLAKMAHGLADNLLTCIYRGYPVDKPLVIAPAMNTDMWNHPLTKEHLETLNIRHTSKIKNRSVSPVFNWMRVAYPVEKKLACGTVGVGAMAGIHSIIDAVRDLYVQKQKENEKYNSSND